MIQQVLKTVEVPQVHYVYEIIEERIVEKIDVPFLCVKGKIIDVVKKIPQERLVEETGVPVPRVAEKTVEVPKVQFHGRVVEVPVVTQRQDVPSMPRERIQECIVEEIIDVAVSRVMEKIIEGMRPIPQERVQSSTVEQSVDALDPQIQEDIVQHNKTLHVIKKNHVKKCLGMFAEIADLNDDHMKFYEQFGKCDKLGVHDDCTVGAKIAELLRPNVSTSKTAEVPQAQFIDKLVDVPVDMPRHVPAFQVAQKTAEIPQVQFI